jgi:hypothetical protein
VRIGGVNKHFNRFTDETMIDAVKDFDGDKEDFYWYRRFNALTLAER